MAPLMLGCCSIPKSCPGCARASPGLWPHGCRRCSNLCTILEPQIAALAVQRRMAKQLSASGAALDAMAFASMDSEEGADRCPSPAWRSFGRYAACVQARFANLMAVKPGAH